ncbi:hypothetical protein HYR99_40115 [Candidatus Poribacteria bacterium]|nr:hypothetical protein [Candidatus Poribacteria bacterium]
MAVSESTDIKQVETILGWASVAYAAGFVTIMIHTARMGIPVVELIKPINIWIGAPLAVEIFYIRKLGVLIKLRKEAFREELAELKKEASNLIEAQDSDWFVALFTALATFLLPFPFRTQTQEKMRKQLFNWMVRKYRFTVQVPDFIRKMLAKTIYVCRAIIAFNRFLNFLLVILLIPVASYIYVVIVYPVIPQSLGGGKPMVVRLIVDSEKIPLDTPELRALFSPQVNTQEKTNNARTTLPVDLLYLTQETYYVRLPNNPIVSMNAGAVQGIIWILRR